MINNHCNKLDTYLGGLDFKIRYLKPYSGRETQPDFDNRVDMSPVPSFAKTGLNEIRNAIYQRMCHINRIGGTPSYMDTARGLNGGVDLVGSTMNTFLGQNVLKELLMMSRVGVFVDMPKVEGPTLADVKTARPYLYLYRAEDIRSWAMDETNNPNEFQSVLLRDAVYTFDPQTNLVNGTSYRYRHLYLQDGEVMVQFYDAGGTKIDLSGEKDDNFEPIPLHVRKIPFVLFELSDSLMADVADYQIALLNLESSDISYILKSNFPFYTEQYDPMTEGLWMRGPSENQTGEAATAQQATETEVKVGISQGRRYPKDLERPGFIAPPGEPLKLSMEKQQNMKNNIRELLHLSLTNLKPAKSASSGSSGSVRSDLIGVEAGLAYIGLELEAGERLIALYWAMLEGRKEIASIKYPEIYTLKSDDDRHKEIDEDTKNLKSIPSVTFKREIAKRLARNLLGPYTKEEVLKQIEKELDAAQLFDSDWQSINKDYESGFVDSETAALARGYPADKVKEMVEQAKNDHADRLARIAQAQSKFSAPLGSAPVGQEQGIPNPGARGLKDQSAPQNQEGNAEKSISQDKSRSFDTASKTRGGGANNVGKKS